jgi:hypothetical protein
MEIQFTIKILGDSAAVQNKATQNGSQKADAATQARSLGTSAKDHKALNPTGQGGNASGGDPTGPGGEGAGSQGQIVVIGPIVIGGGSLASGGIGAGGSGGDKTGPGQGAPPEAV